MGPDHHRRRCRAGHPHVPGDRHRRRFRRGNPLGLRHRRSRRRGRRGRPACSGPPGPQEAQGPLDRERLR
ncbi:hypothetical protein ACFFX0_08830 [Citricoccus parietis]|uniref:Uncharacterized protein n=1 Tax=Citricoccus parietis TaxID=592307 RepID=A0ABV5FX78_9MICC